MRGGKEGGMGRGREGMRGGINEYMCCPMGSCKGMV